MPDRVFEMAVKAIRHIASVPSNRAALVSSFQSPFQSSCLHRGLER